MQHARNIHTLEARPVFAPVQKVARAYNGAGRNYGAYADGDLAHLFEFSGLHSFADKQLWELLEGELVRLRESGTTVVRILDAGCGPGTWLRRMVIRARALGFKEIHARGFDIAEVQIHEARHLARDLANVPGISLRFDCGDLLSAIPEATASVDITICLYSVLSHIAVSNLPHVLAELSRVTKGKFITTVRAIGSEPTIFVDSLDKARDFRLDHERDRCKVEFRNGSGIEVPFHLFSSGELRSRMARHFETEDLCGLDIFHSRFAPDRRWNPGTLVSGEHMMDCLSILEAMHARDPELMDRANHLLFVGRPKSA